MRLWEIALVMGMMMVIQGRFEVYMPTCAANKFDKDIQYTLANFGHILYGRSIVGELYALENEKFCDVDGVKNIVSKQNDVKPFILIKRGGCKFTKKILNAQQKGAQMAIIYDDSETTEPEVIMANDGHGHLIDIPSIFISGKDGKKLKETLQTCESQILKIRFQVYISPIASVTLWLNANNRQSYVMIRDFYRDYYPVIKDKMKLNVRFKVNSDCGHEQCDDNDCVSEKKKYCLATRKQVAGKHLPGKEIITEHLRSYFLWELTKNDNKDLWWNYMIKFDDNSCAQKLDVKTCSEQAMKSLNYDYNQVNSKVQQTYQNLTSNDNTLETFADQAYRGDILFYPEATINNRNFYGLFRAPDIFEMICQSLENPPSQCYTFLKNDRKTTFGQDESKGLWKVIVFILILMVVTFLVALCVYTRLIKRQINQQMSVEVNKMVEHYVQLSQQKSRSRVM